MLIYLPKSQKRQRGFDFFGFAMLSPGSKAPVQRSCSKNQR